MKSAVLYRNIFIAVTCSALIASSVLAGPSIYPTGVTRYDPARAHNSYVIFGSPDGKTHLIDMNGNNVHEWDHFGFPSEILSPDVTGGKRGHVLVQLEASPGAGLPIFRNKTIGELDWDGKILWQWGEQAPGGAALQNHDWRRLSNGNTLVVVSITHAVPGFTASKINDQAIYEVTASGKIVWQWVVADHLEEFGFSAEGLRLIREGTRSAENVTVGRGGGFLTINKMNVVGPNHWFDAGDARFNPDNILVDARNGNFTAIIEKTSGKIVWLLGPYYPSRVDASQNPPPRPVDQISGQHDAHIIPKGLPGAGNLLLFDNQGDAGFPAANLGTRRGSRVLEIDPTRKEIVWEYTGESSDQPTWGFYSSFISSARRLPNGNTLIDEGMNGRFFQITSTGEIVWEYVNPYFGRSSVAGLARVNGEARAVQSNWVYRALPVPYDWAPPGTPRAEKAIRTPDIAAFRVPGAP